MCKLIERTVAAKANTLCMYVCVGGWGVATWLHGVGEEEKTKVMIRVCWIAALFSVSIMYVPVETQSIDLVIGSTLT